MTGVAASVSADIALIEPLTAIISRAAAAVLAFKVGDLKAELKVDESPVTLADHAAQSVILEGLSRLLPDVPVISEEAIEHPIPCDPGGALVLVDPLDGTKDFLSGRDEFTVNIALIRGGAPILGLVAAPALGLIWRGLAGHGADRLRLRPGAAPGEADEVIRIRTRAWPSRPAVTVSRSHFDPATAAFVDGLGPLEALACGSSVKFCRIAEGAADLYPRLAPTSEWDVAAGHAVLQAAGGIVETPDGAPLAYGRRIPDVRIPAFIAWGDPQAVVRTRRGA